MPPHLPPEIIDEIIASVSDDTTLLNCALVCRGWLPASRSRLLNFLDLASNTAYDSFVNNVLHSPRLEPYLASTETVWLMDPSEDDEPPAVGGAPPAWTYRFVHDFAGHLPNVESLTIENADWITRPLHPSAYLALARFSSLKQLSLYECKLPSAQAMRRIVSALSGSLNNLELNDMTCPLGRGDVPATWTAGAPGLALTTLYLTCRRRDNDCLAPFLCWLSQTPTRNSLRDFTFIYARTDVSPHANDYTAFVKSVAPRLEKLRTYIVDAPRGDPVPPPQLSGRPRAQRWRTHWHTVARSLRTLPRSSRIHYLAFTVWPKAAQLPEALPPYQPIEHAAIDDDGLELLEPILQKAPPFRDLESVDFTVLGYTSCTESEAANAEARILDAVQRLLPGLAPKGLISVRLSGGNGALGRGLKTAQAERLEKEVLMHAASMRFGQYQRQPW